jgi:amidohydrolase
MRDLAPIISKLVPELTEFRRELHTHPEIGYEEFRTAKQVADRLAKIPGLEIRTGVAKTGIVAILGSGKSGPCVALRADMDALPITEQTGKPYASRTPGTMHACGHDGHTAALVGAAMVLSEISDELKGPVKFLFQPAEEGGAGARAMIEAGVLESPPVAAIFGLHGIPDRSMKLGQIACCCGPAWAGAMSFAIEVRGVGGHAAWPHRTVDPIYIGAQIVTALQSVVAREVDPLDSGVVTVGKFHAGTAGNVIPDVAHLRGTVRALSPERLNAITERVGAIARSIAAAHRAEAVFTAYDGYPPVINHALAEAVVAAAAERAVEAGSFLGREMRPLMGSEDFAFFTERIPGAYWFLGLRPEGEDYPPLHSPYFDFNDAALPLAIRGHVEIVRQFNAGWSPT